MNTKPLNGHNLHRPALGLPPKVIHYQMTTGELSTERDGRYVDPQRAPEMLCHTGDGHAEGSRFVIYVTCDACLKRLSELKGDMNV